VQFDDWSQIRAGVRCPLDRPRPPATDEWDLIGPLGVSTLYLARNQTYRGHCLLILDLRHASRPSELSAQEWLQFCADLHTAETAITRTLAPDHINIAALGNLSPHLHWHIIPRYRDDPRWGAPIWLTQACDMLDTRLDTQEQLRLVQSLRHALESACGGDGGEGTGGHSL
jgi:diadenosine tetraphosphate (Ap4A) HIT family hydrolase